jgi:5-methylcytosine-specific restriction protein A
MEYSGTELSHKWAEEINKDRDWNSEVTYEGFTKFGINYITELGLLDIDEKDLLIVDISKEQKYQNDSNRVKSITLPPGELPRPKPKNYSGNIKYSTNPRRAKTALESSRFKCEFNENHNTFLNKASNEQYMEAHHLVPMNKQGLFSVDIDVPENILCICPTCHRKIHHAVDEDKLDLLSLALKDRNEALRSRGIEIDIEKLKDFYKID